MNIRERTMAVIKREELDYIPFLIYSSLLPRGSLERKLRNRGLGLAVGTSLCNVTMPNVSVEQKTVGNVLCRTFHTPIGDVSEKIRINLRSFSGGEWRIERLIKDLGDYEVVKFILEDTIYEPNYDDFLNAERDLGEDGIVFAWLGYTPIMQLIVQFMGYQRFIIGLYKHRKELVNLIDVIDRKMVEASRSVAESPADIVKLGDNTDSMLVNPRLFEGYCLPYFKKYVRILHSRNKIVMSHMDGRLKSLKNLIGETDLDVVEAFTPPPGGDFTVQEARETWSDRLSIWVNIPEAIFLLESNQIQKYVRDLLKDIPLGKGFILGITEDIPADCLRTRLGTVVSIIEKYRGYSIEAP